MWLSRTGACCCTSTRAPFAVQGSSSIAVGQTLARPGFPTALSGVDSAAGGLARLLDRGKMLHALPDGRRYRPGAPGSEDPGPTPQGRHDRQPGTRRGRPLLRLPRCVRHPRRRHPRSLRSGHGHRAGRRRRRRPAARGGGAARGRRTDDDGHGTRRPTGGAARTGLPDGTGEGWRKRCAAAWCDDVSRPASKAAD
ncbi:hypothetical protein LT493_25975 [Streptomyces tricolor]|nr:hypothetical protein [Streptomyces tricolor]